MFFIPKCPFFSTSSFVLGSCQFWNHLIYRFKKKKSEQNIVTLLKWQTLASVYQLLKCSYQIWKGRSRDEMAQFLKQIILIVICRKLWGKNNFVFVCIFFHFRTKPDFRIMAFPSK